jgi:dTDP-glucose pyrophosphorylase/CBS domain-containing protein
MNTTTTNAEILQMTKIEKYLISLSTTILQAMSCIDRNSKGIALIVDESQRLLGTVSDGDIRRAILRGVNLDLPVTALFEEGQSAGKNGPLTASVGTTSAALLQLMNDHEIRQIPIVDSELRVVDMAFLTDMVKQYELPIRAVVMAGGFGSRLRPLTDNTPKPMLHIGDRPILERIIGQLKKTGVNRINLTTHFKAETISEHFGNGEQFGVNINYVHEQEPLGTAGALGLLEDSDEPLLVINGDILTQVDFRAMVAFHRRHKSCLTVGVRRYDLQVPYGVMECDGPKILGISEKPKLQFLVNAGIYLLEPSVRQYIPARRRFDMTDLIQALIREKCHMVSFPIVEYWLDIGQYPDYEKAQSDSQDGTLNS